MSAKKERLDLLLHGRGYVPSREKARSMILAGRVFVNDRRVDKPGTKVDAASAIEVREPATKYVSRGGDKLEAALRAFRIDIRNKVALDVGASTGGFTDCMLQHGARKVYAVDVGYGQFAWSLRTDPRVVVIERTNVRHVRPDLLPEKVDFAVVDVSFISLKLVLEPVISLMKEDGDLVTLIKPQFEAGREQVGKGGVVRDPEVQKQVVDSIVDFAASIGLVCSGTTESPLLGPAGNREFLAYFLRSPNAAP
ncbi:MAG: TlyA family RNA methyltransferase [Candidatus Hydrogenedentes bacterium]|nr:TlyA family RNA methyltransferase [Candidatus Hydrogenedentota bacterium]